MFPIKKVFAYDTYPGRSEAYARKMSSELGIEVTAVAHAKQAVSGSDSGGHGWADPAQATRHNSERMAAGRGLRLAG